MAQSFAAPSLLAALVVCTCATGCLPDKAAPTTTNASSSGGSGASSGSGSTGGSGGSSGSTSGAGGALRVAEWNIEFFAMPDAGPTDDALQATNVTAGIQQVAPDIMAFEEVCDEGVFAQVPANLESQTGATFQSIVANDPSLGNAYANYGGSWGQKTALIWRTDVATYVSGQLVYRTDLDPSWGSTFATRDPLEIKLQLADGTILYVIVVHLKSGVDTASYNERVQESADLKTYLEQVHANDAVMVIGDWNDDLDSSITSGEPSPFSALVADTADYVFTTMPFSTANESTLDTFQGHPIDHHLVNKQLFNFVINNSAQIIHPNIVNYGDTTSDHYPTLVQYQRP
ncbi:MAG: endonuclease/exonuclease/phosphatase family protein [Deltaproteobacteria bacterium]|nr:endonuclease/exonuclease/phosphatase family protein [Deltaproteobacteria bacterium]